MNVRVQDLPLVSNISTYNKGHMTLAIRFGSHQRDNDQNYLSKVIIIIVIIIIRMYSLSDLGFSSNLIGPLSKQLSIINPLRSQ